MKKCTKCTKCLEIKPIDSFFRNKYSHSPSGREYQCKRCQIRQYREKRKSNPGLYKRKDKNYYKKHKEEIRAKRREYYINNKEKNNARYKVRYAIKMGKLIKMPCEKCGDKKSLAHHPDYQKPLDVIWLCSRCHMLLHHGI